MENNQNDQQEAVNQVYNYAANLLVNEKRSPGEVRDVLKEQGIDEESATVVVENLEKQIQEGKKERANKDMRYGALWCIGGIIVTALTYSAASGGGSYVVAWGAILFGAIQFFRGLANSK